MKIALAAVGFTSTIAQIVLMRELVATFYGNELLFGLVLTAWLAWVAAGSWGLARLAERRRLGVGTFAAGLALAAPLLPVQICLVRDVRALLGVTPGAFVEFGPMVGAVAIYSGVFPLVLSLPIPAPALVFPLLALLAGTLTGMAFPLAVALTRGSAGRVAGMLYGADLVGGCVGALLAAVLLVPVLGIPQTCAAVALVGLAGLLVLA